MTEAVEYYEEEGVDIDLHPKQEFALNSSATEVLYGGAAGGGKSFFLRALAVFFCSMIPNLNVYLFRRTYDDLMKNHMEGYMNFHEMLAQWVDEGYVTIVGDKEVRFWNGSKIFLCHCQHEKDMYKYQGAQIHMLLIDELTTFSEKIYRFLRGRCRLGGLFIPSEYKGLFPRIYCGSNPGNVGHNWVKKAFVDRCIAYEVHKMDKKEGGMLRQYIPAVLSDNPTLEESDPDYLEKLEGLGNPALVQAMKDGNWDITSGGMFDDIWNRDIHVIKPFRIPASWTIKRSFDWGSSKPFSVGWWAESDGTEAILADGTRKCWPRGTRFRIGEWYGWNGEDNTGLKMTSKKIATGIKNREFKMGYRSRVKPGPADSSIFDREDDHCIYDDFKSSGVIFTHANKIPGSRVNGWNAMRTMLENSTKQPMEGPGLFIFDTCRDGFIRTVPTLPRDENKSEDVDTKAEDHAADESRYYLFDKPKVVAHTALVGV